MSTEQPTNPPADAGTVAAFGDGDARAAWNAGARAFEAFVESGADYYRLRVHGPGLLAACEPVAEWSALISDAGFMIRRLHEPRPTAAEVQQMTALDDSWRLPYFLVFDLVKRSPD